MLESAGGSSSVLSRSDIENGCFLSFGHSSKPAASLGDERFGDRLCVSGAGDDRTDARVLVSALGTDRPGFRRIDPRGADVTALREPDKTGRELTAQRVGCISRFRGLLRRYYPRFAEILDE